MSQFYVSIMFIGIILIVISFVWILFDRKQTYDYSKGIDEKKAGLLNIIEDAEEMLQELNKFSDFIVQQMDTKNEELNAGLTKIDERLKQLDLELKESFQAKTYKAERAVNGAGFNFVGIPGSQFEVYGKEHINENQKLSYSSAEHTNSNTHQSKTKEKVIPLNGKYKEVLRLSDDGLNITEIAKTLNMGKGEIQLILGMNK